MSCNRFGLWNYNAALYYNLDQLIGRSMPTCWVLKALIQITGIAAEPLLNSWNPTTFNVTSQPYRKPVVTRSYNSFFLHYVGGRQLLSVLSVLQFLVSSITKDTDLGFIFFLSFHSRRGKQWELHQPFCFLAMNLEELTHFNSLNIFAAL